ncbi:CDP-alcohol phosphatidyltransferase family protein [Pontibacter sp. G13]|uniref:CDP-alcohol phosphatidyltransferase family protein n=1 Tax=Pontibacter sp. G13 TaxID=3074898 RepID=UPI00288B58CF|nr:CDP-alcohol phosphatidyltransferase family protein [Pontibacter sp. G13]WNJ16796.1 CDP-alcohol phosphatidyltransferase family protein [Pontibacter sp. G13]
MMNQPTLTTAPSKFVQAPALIQNWVFAHAILMLGGSVITWIRPDSWSLILLGMASFAGFFISNRPNWQPLHRWSGPANWVTGSRVIAMAGLVIFHEFLTDWQVAFWALAVLALDGIDGYLARKFHTSSLFGEFLDKETDAWFVLAMGWILWQRELAPAWIWLPGILRYAYVIAIRFIVPKQRSESRSKRGQYIAVLLMGSLIGACVLPEPLGLILLGVATLSVSYSFGASFLQLFSQKDPS